MSIAIKKQPRPLPASQNFATLKRRACETVLLPRHPEALEIAGEAINDALRRINTRRWKWSIRSRIYNVVADKREYEVPTDYAGVNYGRWLDENQVEVFPIIEYMDPFNFGQSFLSVNPRSRESYYFTVENEYEFAEPLKFAYPVDPGQIERHPYFKLSYYSNLPRLEADGDTFQAPPEIELYVLLKAKSALAQVYKPERWNALRQEAELMWADMAQSDNRRNLRAM